MSADAATTSACCLDQGIVEVNAGLEGEVVNDGRAHRGKIILLFGISRDGCAFQRRCSGENPLLCASYYFSLFLLGKTKPDVPTDESLCSPR